MPVMTEHSQRPNCVPGSKDECFLPRISHRGSSSDSDSLQDYRRAPQNLPSSETASVSSSPIKLPAINGKSKSNSVSSLTNGHSPSREREEPRTNLCRSPSCPSNLGFWYEREDDLETPTPESHVPYSSSKRGSCDLKLPSIKDRNSICSGSIASQFTVRSQNTQRDSNRNGLSRDLSPANRHLSFSHDVLKEVPTPRGEQPPDSQRSINQSALLLPIRNSESRMSLKKKKKKKKHGSRQNTEPSIKSENTSVNDGNQQNSNSFEKVKSKMDTIDSRGYFSDADTERHDERCISRVTEENQHLKSKGNVVSVKKRRSVKRVTDNSLYFERELTQVNA